MNTRSTVQRQLVMEAVQRLYHPTAEDVYGMVVKSHPNVSKATVYRNLNVLADTGQIRRVQLLDAAVRFDGRLNEHCHAQCRECGCVLDVSWAETDGGLYRELNEQGFEAEGREVLIHGVCADCQRRRRESGDGAFHG